MSTSISDLPIELLDRILELLSTAEFHALCQTSKNLHRIAEPHLYARLDWIWHFGWPEHPPYTMPLNIKVPPLIPFLLTIARKPKLASFVETINLGGDDLSRITHTFLGRQSPISVFGVDLSELIAMVHHFDFPNRDQWVEDLQCGTVDAFVALLLAQAPNLKSLTLGENFLRDGPLTHMVLKQAALENVASAPASAPTYSFPSAGLAHLERVHMQLSLDARYRTKHSQNTEELLSLFYLSAARRLTLSIDNPSPAFQWPVKSAPSPIMLTSLDLTMLKAEYLGHVLSVTSNLRSLRWQWLALPFTSPDHYDPIAVLHLDTIVAALWHVRASLQNLNIQASYYDNGCQYLEDPGIEVQGSLCRMSTGFPALNKLEIPLLFLARSNRPGGLQPIAASLPRHVRELTIVMDKTSVDESWAYLDGGPADVIEEWLREGLESTPELRQFCFVRRGKLDEKLSRKLLLRRGT